MPEGETSRFKLPYPKSSGEVKLGAKDIEELAAKVDEVLPGRPENKYVLKIGVTKAECEAGVEPSATRFALVTLYTPVGKIVGAIEVGGVTVSGNVGSEVPITYGVPPGQKWKCKPTGTIESNTLLL